MSLPDLNKKDFTHADIVAILTATKKEDVEAIQVAAEKVLLENCGNEVRLRGLIEVSNICRCDCYYCGIRKSDREVERYEVTIDDILEVAKECVKLNYGSMVMQAGERHDKNFIDMIEEAVRLVREKTKSETLPEGLGITLSLGEQSHDVFQRWFDAGAHRYLLRIESSNPDLFAKIHPAEQKFSERLNCIKDLQKIGYQTGTGVMIGLPEQTVDDLANDILFFKENDIDMIGMGPFIPHEKTPLYGKPCPDVAWRVKTTLLMIAAARLVMRDINIVATTALQTLDSIGREKALRFGSNVMMPILTPMEVRKNYQLYPGKVCLTDEPSTCNSCLKVRIGSVDRVVGQNDWGDSPHALKKKV